MKKSKFITIFVGVCSLVVILSVCLTGCKNTKYFEEVSSYTFWANKREEAIAQTHVYDMVKEHMSTDNGKDKKVLSCVKEGNEEKDVIFCIYDWADHNGHNTGFTNENRNYVNAVRTNDALMYEVIKTVESRQNYENEDWLIILTADHGSMRILRQEL